MPARGIERLALLSADVAGPDHARRHDPEAAGAWLGERREAIARIIAEHQGHLLITAKDTTIAASLPDAVDAVRAALEIQEQIARENRGRAAAEHVQYGIGIDCGEVTVEDERLSGPVVDVAGALQTIARPATVVVSKAVFEQIRTRMRFVYRILGEQRIGDLPYLVEAYQIKKVARPGRRFDPIFWARRPTFAAAAAGLLLLLLGGLWQGYHRLAAPVGEQTLAPTVTQRAPVAAEGASNETGTAVQADSAQTVDAAGEPPEASPGERPPIIAVLPLANASGDPEEAYFSDGLTDSLITDLGRFAHLTVIAAETMFTYRGNRSDPVATGRELGAGYLLEGAAAHAGGQLQLEARLLDARTGAPLWQEAYEARSDDPAATKHGLTQRILATLEGRDPARSANGSTNGPGTHSLQAYDYGLRWRELFNRFEPSANRRARQAALRAIELDPGYAAAYAYVAWTHMADYWWGWAADRQAALAQALEWAKKGVRRDADDFDAQWALGDVHQATGRFGDALEAYQAALAINPNAAGLMQDIGTWMLPLMGRAEAGLKLAEKAVRLNPHHPETYDGNIAFNYYLLERYEDAIEAVNRMREPRVDHLLYLAASYAQLDRLQKARLVIATVLASKPGLTVEGFLKTLPLQRDADRDHLREGLHAAGLPRADA